MESLIVNFIQFFSAMAKSLFLQRRLALVYVCSQFRDFTKIFSFSKSFGHSWGNWYILFVVIMIEYCFTWDEKKLD